MAQERLQKVLAAAGIASRRASEDLIAAGRVRVGGQTAVIGQQVDPATDRITVDGVPVRARPATVHLALHKPAGVTSTVQDRHAERTVVDLIPPDLRDGLRLYPVGRLDQDSEGLLLLTNDGPWAERVLHPRNRVEREYAMGLVAPLGAQQARDLTDGIALEEGLARVGHLRPATAVETRRLVATMSPQPGDLVWYRGTLEQGWKRQLRRMLAAVGEPIVRLVRVRIGTVRLDDLNSGATRRLTPLEVRTLGAGPRPDDDR